MRNFWVVILACLPWGLNAFGQVAHVFNRFSRDKGLSTNDINTMWQDSTGFMWIGTADGLQRFDGSRFVRYGFRDIASAIPPKSVEQILPAGEKSLWLVQGHSIGIFDHARIKYREVAVAGRDEMPATAEFRLFRDSRNMVFLCIRNFGLLWYNDSHGRFEKNIDLLPVPPRWPVSGIVEDEQKGVYWISSDSGLAVFNRKTGKLNYRGHNVENYGLIDRPEMRHIWKSEIGADGTMWISYWAWVGNEFRPRLMHFDPDANRVLPHTRGMENAIEGYYELKVLKKSRSGQIWIGGVNSLFSFDPARSSMTNYNLSDPGEYNIHCEVIRDIFEDAEENIWICTSDGLFVTHPNRKLVFSVFTEKGRSTHAPVQSLLETQRFENWVGTWGKGMLYYDKYFQPINFDPYKNAPVTGSELGLYKGIWDICQHSRSGLIWSACQGGRIAIYDPDTKWVKYWLHPPAFGNSTIRQLKEDANGKLWFATNSGRLLYWDPVSAIDNRSFNLTQEFNTVIYRIYFDKEGRIWVTTHAKGVYVLSADGLKVIYHFRAEDPGETRFSDKAIKDVQQYNDSLFFVCGGIGFDLINIRSGKIANFSLLNGLPGAIVSQMMLDHDGLLWMVTNNGLCSYNHLKGTFNTYSSRDGLIFTEKATQAKWLMRNGEIWFGGENILFGFLPDMLKMKTPPPPVVITDFKVLNSFHPLDSLMAQKEIRLNSDQHTFTIAFSSLSFLQNAKLTFYYKLTGIDDDWIPARDMEASYYLLPPGRYNFQVKCENIEGLASRVNSTIHIRILPPFYRTWWFISALIVVGLGLIYLIYRLRVNRLLAVERLRSKVARDLHDDMGSTLSTINILSTMAKTKLNTDTRKTSDYLSKITDNSQRMMEAMDDIVWSIKPDNDSMQKITARMREYATSTLEARNIDLDFLVEEEVHQLKLNMAMRRDFFLIFKEVVNNAAKYSKCRNVRIRIGLIRKRLIMSIADDGCGFDLEKADHGNGISNIRKRASAMGGRLTLKSKLDSGTEVVLNVPAR